MLGLHEKWRETFMEAWPEELAELALPAEHIPLGKEDMLTIGARTGEFRDIMQMDELPPLGTAFRQRAAEILASFPQGAHVRLGGCSFKKQGLTIAPVFSLKQLETLMLQENPRIAGLLADALREEYPVNLYFRPWVNIPHWCEFRLFMKGRQLVGASQYFHERRFDEIGNNIRSISYALIDFAIRFRDCSHMGDVVADVYVESDVKGDFRAVLIETNPYIRRTDPCLFSWVNDGDFDYGLRFRNGAGRICAVAPLPFPN